MRIEDKRNEGKHTSDKAAIIIPDGKINKNTIFNVIEALFDDMLFHLDIETRVLINNGASTMNFGMPEVVDNFPMSLVEADIIYPGDLSTFLAYGYDMLAGNGGMHEVRVRGNDGVYNWFNVKCVAVKNENGEVKEIIGRLTNIHDKKENENQDLTDALTRTQNRLSFEENVNFILSNESKAEHAFCLIDLDDFKNINDRYGHEFGDLVLKSFADRIRNRVQKKDFIGRIAGDKFVLFMREISSEETVRKRVQQLLEDLRSEYSDGNKSKMINASLGVARYPHDGLKYEVLYEKSNKALLSSKNSGKDRATIYNGEL